MKKSLIAWTIIISILISVYAAMPVYAENMPYYIDVDLTNQITTVYRTSDGSIVRQMICSSGINDSTPQGKWQMVPKGRASERSAWTYLAQYKCYVKYATRVHLGYMFHSLPYASKESTEPDPESVEALGTPASHGCIRLRWEDAYFIAKNCQTGTWVNFHKDNAPNEELRTILKEASYTDEDGLTYNEFLGYSEDALARGSSGQAVLDLQHRLTDLGYFDGEITGIYEASTMTAIKEAQADLGLAQTGVTTDELQAVLFSNEAPVSSGNTELKIGSSGPVVAKLQEALKEIGVFNGEPNGIFDPETENAVKLFQGVCNFVSDGVATPLLQKILYYELGLVKENCGDDFVSDASMEEIIMAKVQSEMKIILRSKPNTDSDGVGKLKDGDIVIVNAVKGDWAQILYGSTQGYMKKKYLNGYKQKNTMLKFSGSQGNYSIGHSMQDYMNGAESLSQKYANGIPKANKTMVVVDQTVTVNTGSDDVSMNLRSGPGSENDVIGEVPNGTVLDIIEREDGWTRVSYNATEGFLMNDYLIFNGDAFEGSGDFEDEEGYDEETTAIVISAGGANVYAQPSADAQRLKSLNAGTEVKVLDMAGGDYVRIAYSGKDAKQAYVFEKDLQFQLS